MHFSKCSSLLTFFFLLAPLQLCAFALNLHSLLSLFVAGPRSCKDSKKWRGIVANPAPWKNGKLVPVLAPASTAFASTALTPASASTSGTRRPIFARPGFVDRQRAPV